MAERHSKRNGTARAALYLRRSSDRQERSISDQRTECTAYAERRGYRLLSEYLDDGISGWKSDEREGFRRLIEDAQSGQFDVVVVWDVDRFSRFPVLEANHYWFLLNQAGVQIDSVSQGKLDFDDLGEWLKASVTQHGKAEYVRDLAHNTLRGRLRAAIDGKGSAGNAPYGYQLVGRDYEIVPDEAEIVRRIFDEYLESGASLRSVSDLLNKEGIPSPKGRRWNATAVRERLRNRKYTGAYVWGQGQFGVYFRVKDRDLIRATRLDERRRFGGSPIIHEDRHEAIVDLETFERVQKKLDEGRLRTSPAKGERRYKLSGLLVCRHCGRLMTGVPKLDKQGVKAPWYQCASYHYEGRSACNANSIKEDALVDTVIDVIRREYLSDEALDRFRRAVRKAQSSSRKKTPRVDVKRIEKRVEELDRQIDRGTERVLNAPDDLVDSIYARLKRVRKERDRLQDELRAAERAGEAPERSDAKEVEQAIFALENLRATLEDTGPAETRDLLGQIISKIELEFSHRKAGKYTRSKFERGTIAVKPAPQFSYLLQGS